jgi:hypothetical protein
LYERVEIEGRELYMDIIDYQSVVGFPSRCLLSTDLTRSPLTDNLYERIGLLDLE